MDVRFVVVALGTYPVEEFSAGAQVEDKIKIVRSLPRMLNWRPV